MLFLCQKTHGEKTKSTGKMSASPRYRMKIHRVVESEDSLGSNHFFFRDASLKLLVVPRDEDILQMAYQNSVYRSGSEPHRGGASEIPEPPPAHRPVPSYAARGRHMSDSAISVHRSKHHPSQQKYKAELRVLPEDGTGPQV